MTACATINHLEWEIKDNLAEYKNAVEEMSKSDLSIGLLTLAQKYRNNYSDPAFKSEAQDLLSSWEEGNVHTKLDIENKKILKTAHIEKGIEMFKRDLWKHLTEQGMTNIGHPGAWFTRLLRFLNYTYKTQTLWYAVGRPLIETAQGMSTYLMAKLTQVYDTPKLADGFSFPNPGRLDKKAPYATREVNYNRNLIRDEGPSWTNKLNFINSLAKTGLEYQGNVLDKTVWTLQNKTYQWLHDQYLIEKAKEIEMKELNKRYPDKNSEEYQDGLHHINSKIFTPVYSKYLFSTWKLTPENNRRKNNILNEVKRKATAEAWSLYFDYVDNPLWIHKLEEMVPFSNFMYTWFKNVIKYPKSMMFMATYLNNLLYTYWENSMYTDDDGEKIDNGLTFRTGALAALGLWEVALNLNRVASFSPASTWVGPLPLFSAITNREDFRYKRFYESGSTYDMIDAALSTLGGTLGKVFSDARHLSEPYKSWQYDAFSDLTSTLAYMATGAPIRDKTQQSAYTAFFKWDIDYLLSLKDFQLQEFFKRQGTWKNSQWLSRKALEMAKLSQTMGLSDPDYKKAPQKALLLAINGLWVLSNTVDGKEYNEATNDMAHLLDVVLGQQFDMKNPQEFNTFLENAKAFIAKPGSKEYEKFNPVLYKNWKFYADNYSWYKDQSNYMEVLNKKWPMDPEVVAMGFAQKYRFKWDEWMNLDTKTKAIMSGKLKNVLMSPANTKEWVPAGITMTDWYWNHMSNKWYLVQEYLNRANETIALTKARKLYNSLGYAEKENWNKAKSNEFFNKARSLYELEKQAHIAFQKEWNYNFDLYVLSQDSKNFEEKMQKANSYIQWSYKQSAKITTSKFDQLVWMSPQEKDAMNKMFGTNVDKKITTMARDMVSDTANQHYSSQTNFPELLQLVTNQ